MPASIDTRTFAESMRGKIIRPSSRELLISRLSGSDQEQDLSSPTNCGGLGRIRHFERSIKDGWPSNPLPIDPACRALGFARQDGMEAQVFQNAACAWRCWYCYVPFNLLAGDASRGEWITANELVERYINLEQRPTIIDLSGGSPDLTPEWIPWMMDALRSAGMDRNTYLWSDDNLSTDYVFTKLNSDERQLMAGYTNYGRVCCIKGFDRDSFSFNTTAISDGYDQQFELLHRYMELGIDLFGYITLTGNDPKSAEAGVTDLINRLTKIHENLPLRFVPLKITNFSPTEVRGKFHHDRFALADQVQSIAINQWNYELRRRFTSSQLRMNIAEVPL